MSRRTHACLTCPGRTRHDNQICATCRRRGRTADGHTVRVTLLLDVPDVHAPTKAQLDDGVDLGEFTWRTR